MNRSASVAAKLPECERKDLAILALTGSETVRALADRHNVSRKFVYEQVSKAGAALDDAFAPVVTNVADEVLFMLPVTDRFLQQVTLALTLICHSSYRGVVEFMRDVLGASISLGRVHDIHQQAAQQADAINCGQDLSAIRVGLHDELFQGAQPVLAGVDARSTYCYLLAAEAQRDGDTWYVHLHDAKAQGLDPDYTIADAGSGLRAGQKLAWGDTPCHGDVFHIQHQCETLVNLRTRIAMEARNRRKKLQTLIDRGFRQNQDGLLVAQLKPLCQAEARTHVLALELRTLVQWLGRDILALAGPDLATRQELFDFVVDELRRREHEDVRRIRPVRRALQNQRDDLLAFAGVLDGKLAAIAQAEQVPDYLVRAACVLHRKPTSSPAYWQGWSRLRSKMGSRFHAVFSAVSQALANTPRSSSLVENLNSRLRNYFTLRRHLGNAYLGLLQFFLNHRRFMRSRHVGRVGRSPREVMTGQPHPHWLTLLGLGTLQSQRA
ncbi:hypothetical protein [Paraburkholderia sp. BL10I2N1]|uniref:hypothetical protein n=1 Tax=Paraburkholderia sp. BL10I2N1 TaxID=1938796 RepID=UPI00105FBEAA|nr:hypothetical protein [Paraburkholderia sp. BL10I2N1]TDN62242.1 hypothetical protein B0G77_5786 [Paraburkholderia sp. BL10I2N1]